MRTSSWIVAVVVATICAFSGASAQEPWRVPWIPGDSAIKVDGFLSEWDTMSYGAATADLARNGADVRARFRSFADDRFLYLGLRVDDKDIHFSTAPFNESWRSDSVEVYIATDSIAGSGPAAGFVRSGLIRVSADRKGETVIEGAASIDDGFDGTRLLGVPSLWQSLGVSAALARLPDGYAVELAIPRSLLGSNGDSATQRFRMNVLVCDNAGERPRYHVLSWAHQAFGDGQEPDEASNVVSIVAEREGLRGAEPPDVAAARSAVYTALRRLDERRADLAIVALQQVRNDRRLQPLLATAYIAAGQVSTAIPILETIAGEAGGESLNLWAIQHLAVAASRLGSYQDSKAHYRRLIASGLPGFRDIGTSGLIECELAEGNEDAAVLAYKAAVKNGNEAGSKTAGVIGEWLRGKRKTQEAAEVFASLAQSRTAFGRERTWALYQLQLVHGEAGQIEAALDAGWRLQATADEADPFAAAGLPSLAAAYESQRTAGPVPAQPFYERFSAAVKDRMNSLGPARTMALAGVLRNQERLPEAAELYGKVASQSDAPRHWRAKAMLALQELQRDRGDSRQSTETGLRLQELYPEVLQTRVASAKLLSQTCADAETSSSVKVNCASARARLQNDLNRRMERAGSFAARQARALWFQLADRQENNPNVAK